MMKRLLTVIVFVTLLPAASRADWLAFIDQIRGPGTSNNVTAVDMSTDDGGVLTNVLNGAATSAGFTITRVGTVSTAGSMSEPDTGTPASQVFGGFVDFAASPSSINGQLLPSATTYTITFTNLDPARRYQLAATSVRGALYPLRWTACAIQGADSFLEAHTGGCITNADPRVPGGTITNGQVALNAGSNSTAGDVIRWLQINPGADRQFSVEMAQWLGAIPGGTAGDAYSYTLAAIRLEEGGLDGPPVVTTPMQNRTNSVGAAALFSVGASGTAPLFYHWFTNGIFVLTNGTGSFTSAPLSAGSNFLCTVIISNALGTATNSASAWGTAVLPPGNVVTSDGYTNAFSALPSASQWSTLATGGSAGSLATIPGLDAAVQTNTAARITNTLVSGANPPNANPLATWSTSGYVQTSPSSIAATLLMGTFVNGTAADAGGIRVRYLYTTNTVTGEALAGQRVYYSQTGVAGSWVAIPGLSQRAGGNLDLTFALAAPWTAGARLYLLWVDSNASVGDMLCQMDNFSLSLSNTTPAALACSLTSPANGFSAEQPADITLTASASGPAAVSNVLFRTNGVALGSVSGGPYTLVWSNAPAGDFALSAIASDTNGASATSSVVNITVTPLVTNTIPPVIATVSPARGATVTNLTSVQVTFSESVTNVDATDFLVNGVAAGSRTGSGSNYTFNFSSPPLGAVEIAWVTGHGIRDRGTPSLAFDETATNASWSYTLADLIAPTVTSKAPAAGATLTNLTSLQVVFSETVFGVNAADLLVNGIPATGLSGGGATYTFAFGQPSYGTVAITWAAGHGITDLGGNPFNASGAGATWNYNLQGPIIVLVGTNANYKYWKGFTEASSPTTLWRMDGFDDSSWTNGDGPFAYDTNPSPIDYTVGAQTLLPDMPGAAGYLALFLRHQFTVPAAGSVTNIILRHRIDDGAIIWLNGIEIYRSNMGVAGTEYSIATGAANATDPAGYTTVNLPASVATLFRTGTNLIAIQGQNANLTSSDFINSIELSATLLDPLALPPAVNSISPVAGNVLALTNITITFSEGVQDIDATDLLINGNEATSVDGTSNVWTWTFPQPAYGGVNITWAGGANITDLDSPPKPFVGSPFSYTLLNPSAPTIAILNPAASATMNTLTSIAVTFSEPVMGVNASDLLISGAPAGGVTGSSAGPYTFAFAQPPYGSVAITWAAGHGITDLEPGANAFNPAQPGNTWSYSLADQTPPTLASLNPPAGATVTNLTSLTLTFSEAVVGVNAGDLLVNGTPATGLSGSGAGPYTFTFAQPNTSVVNVNWAIGHGIADTAANPFNGAAVSWQYFTPDNVPPMIAAISPAPGATVRDLTQLQVTFSEPVVGVNAADLLINNLPAAAVAGSAAGPYTFTFAQPATGAVSLAWAPVTGIADLAAPPNPFAGGEWGYVLNPNAVFADRIVINEIMFQPPTFRTNDEWIELRNLDTAPVNLNGWKFTKGVDYTFPDVSIPAGGHLVVVANVAAFQAKYPGVTNFVGPWSGDLANNGQTIRLETSLGETVNEVGYASEGDWATRIRGPVLSNHRGWIWRSPAADGSGPALELMNPAMPNKYGRNWRSSLATNGTPGAANSVTSTNIGPLILDLAHFPAVPRSTNAVTVTAKILDERTNGLVVTVFFRDASTITPPAFSALTMFDDGGHNDGASGDKYFAASIPAQANSTVVEFYVQAVDANGNTNTWPAAAYDEFNVPGQYANALYQVDDSAYAFPQPLYKLIMTETERRERRTIETTDTQSNAEMNGSLITIDGTGMEVRYNIGIRERGAGSRGRAPANQRVNVPTDRRWKGQREFNLNTQYTESQYAGYLLARKSGLDTEAARIVRVTINNTNNANSGSPQFGCYIHVEAPNSDFAAAHFPLDDAGNVYRCTRPNTDLSSLTPPTAQSYIAQGYAKASNASENDFSDLTNLTYVLRLTNANFTANVRANVNVEQWMLYFAVTTLLSSEETSLGTGVGDDYGLYRGVNDPRFMLIAHDWDTVLNQGDSRPNNPNQSIFRAAALSSIDRFIHWPEFGPIYYATLRRLCATTFSPSELGRTLDEGLGSFAQSEIANMKAFASNRVTYVLSQLPPDTNAPAIAPTTLGGTITSNVTLAAASGPHTITSALTVSSGVTVTIQPGVTVQLASGVNITVANGGRLLAEGTAASPILFTRSGGANWGHIIINGAVGSPESRISHARIEFNATSTTTPAIDVAGGTAVLDYLTFGNTAAPYIHVDIASFVVSHCEFPGNTASFEPVHGTGGIKSGGRGIFYRNWWGPTVNGSGYNDSIDFTGGNRNLGQPILQLIDNVFTGSQDDLTDLDGTDVWIEGNIFLHAHRQNGSPDSASAVSGGKTGTDTSEITILGNIFFDVDQAATAKELNYYTFVNNTVVHQSGAGYLDAGITAVLNFGDDTYAQARGGYAEGNILYDIERLTRYVTNGTVLFSNITFNGNLMPLAWAGSGATNLTSAPLFKHVPTLAETTNFTNWAPAQILRDWLSLRPGSPGLGNGPNGSDKGVIPIGATVAVGVGATTNDAVFTVGINRTNSATVASGGFPNGSGYTHYKWRLDGGAWSAETPAGTKLAIPGFRSGAHRLDVNGKRDSGMYQDDAGYGELAGVASVFSGTARRLLFNEILASNGSRAPHEGTYPDIIELFNPGSSQVNLAGLRLTDDIANPDKFIFAMGTVIPAGGYLAIYANNADGTSGIHAGFSLNKDGQSIYLYDTVDNGGLLIDSITFGLQLTDYSIGCVGADWMLCTPTFGGPNLPAATAPASRLLINEILTSAVGAFPDDFVELYNPQPLPVALAGLYFTDNPAHWPNRSPLSALTYISAGGYIAFHADGKKSKGADHLDFSLESERGLVALLNPDYSIIDCILYGSQTTDVSQGRVPQNIYDNNFFVTPTPGAPNPGIISTNSGVVINEVLAANQTIRELDGSTPDWIELYNLGSTNVDLGDYSLSDASLLPRKYVFASGTIIPPGGYLRLYCDGSLTNSATNTGFNIKAEGGSVYLFGRLAAGGTLLNAVTYGLQATDFSISRMPNGTGNWALTLPTPGGASLAAGTASAALVKINEWMPRPASGQDWFELWNPNAQPVAIGGYFLTDDLNDRTKSLIPALSFLGASTNGYQRFWADGLTAAGANHTSFSLNNTAESVGLANPAGVLIDGVSYASPALGVSEGRFPDGAATLVRFPGTDSPGDPNYLLITNVLINEALTHTDPPLEDAIELRNLTAAPVAIGDWWLSDAKAGPRKFRIPTGTTIPANGFVVFYEYQFNNDPTNNLNAFSLSSGKGDEIFLSTGDPDGNLTGYRTSVGFGAAANGVSFGRYLTSDGRQEFVAMSARTLGQDDPGSLAIFRSGSGLANPYPKVGPVVISRIHYHPPDLGTNDDTLNEYLELKNISGAEVQLYDALAPTNTWRLRDAVDFDFPQGFSLPAGGNLVLVSFDPANNPAQLATFRGTYGLGGNVPVLGPYTGKLANNDDKVELYKPDSPNPGDVPYILVERVHYYDLAPWPATADGTGLALQRVSLGGFGNDATNWIAAAATFGGVVDTDGDGMPDSYENLYAPTLNPAVDDAGFDPDGDGMTNLQEYQAGTNPTQAGSVLRITSILDLGGNNARLTFLAISNRTYGVEYKNLLNDPSWTTLTNMAAAPVNRNLQFDTPIPTTNRFYRLRTP